MTAPDCRVTERLGLEGRNACLTSARFRESLGYVHEGAEDESIGIDVL